MSWEPPFSTGADGAEPTGLRRLLRQPSARRNLVIGAAVLGAALLLLPRGATADRLPPSSFGLESFPSLSPEGQDAMDRQPGTMLGTPADALTPVPASSAGGMAPPVESDTAVYTIYLYKLPGLAPDARPGSSLDIWVTWKPPLTERPEVQLLLEGVRLSRIESGFDQGPVADLLLDDQDVPDLIYGERFGSFNVVTEPN